MWDGLVGHDWDCACSFNCVISVRCGSKLMKTEKWAKEICIEGPGCLCFLLFPPVSSFHCSFPSSFHFVTVLCVYCL